MPEEIYKLTRNKTLCFQEMESGLWVIQNIHKEYVLLYLYANPAKTIELPITDIAATTFFIGTNKIFPISTQTVIAHLQEIGFFCHATSFRFSKMLGRVSSPETVILGGLEIRAAGAEDVTQILCLWEETFDLVANQIPDSNNLIAEVSDGNVICAFIDGVFAGVLVTGFTKSELLIRHVAVAREFRGKSIGTALVAAAEEVAQKKGLGRSLLWVIEGNKPALSLYNKLGYNTDGRFMTQYTLAAPD